MPAWGALRAEMRATGAPGLQGSVQPEQKVNHPSLPESDDDACWLALRRTHHAQAPLMPRPTHARNHSRACARPLRLVHAQTNSLSYSIALNHSCRATHAETRSCSAPNRTKTHARSDPLMIRPTHVQTRSRSDPTQSRPAQGLTRTESIGLSTGWEPPRARTEP